MAATITSAFGIPVVWIPADATNQDPPSTRTGTDLIILHDIEGDTPGAIARFQAPNSGGSTQFVLDPSHQRIVQMVGLDAVAYGCGNLADNRRANQFEMPGFSGKPYDPAVIDQAVSLGATLALRDGIPPVKLSRAQVSAGMRGFCGHEDIPDPHNPNLGGGEDHHTDPGPTFPWTDYLKRVQALMSQPNAPQVQFFAQTNHSIGGGFLQYWQTNGGVEIFGYPLTEEYTDPATKLTMQDFERARFELHPGSDPTKWDVQLGRVNAELLDARAQLANVGTITQVWPKVSAAIDSLRALVPKP